MIKKRSYARITLALDIVRKLDSGPFSGYHELGIVKHQIDLYDVVSVESSEKLEIECDNKEVPVNSSNLCWKVVELIKKKYEIKDNVKITIKKKIPLMGGLAGGSSNAAATLSLLNKFWNLGLSKEEMIKLGREIGMDVPYYFVGGTAFDTESTGILEKINTGVKLNFILVTPDFGVSTVEAYKNIDYDIVGRDVEKTEAMKRGFVLSDKKLIISNIHNDFDNIAEKMQPETIQIKERMVSAGCLAVGISGSGSTLFGDVESEEKGKEIQGKINEKSILVKSL